jgi:hypothetical protein
MKATPPLVLSSLALLAPSLLGQLLPQGRPAVDVPTANPRGVPAVTAGLPVGIEPTQVLVDPQADGSVWALGASWKARFDSAGCRYLPFFGSDAPRLFPVDLSLRTATVGGQAIELTAGQPASEGTTIRVDRGGLVETWALAMREIEQSFVFHTLPNRGAVSVELAVASELRTEPLTDGLRFLGELGHVDYTKAVAVDAAGRRRSLAIEWRGDAIAMTIPADFVAEAQLPLVLDPIITTVANLGANPANQYLGDVATVKGPDYIMTTWLRTFAVGDKDCFAAVYDPSWNLVIGPAIIDFTGEDWRVARAAANKSVGNFLVVGEVFFGGATWVAGRTVGLNGGTSLKFDIERAGVVGLPGATKQPDVGGDPISAGAAYYCVVFTKEITATDTDIYCKMVDTNGNLQSAMPTRLSTYSVTGAAENRPSISNSNPGDMWMVVWQYEWQSAPFDPDVRGAVVNWNGAITTPDFGIAISLEWEWYAAVSSPADVGAGAPRFLVAWDHAGGGPSVGPRDVRCRLVQASGALDAIFDLDNNSAGGAYASLPHLMPRVDSDGARFVVAYDEVTGTTPYTVVDTIAAPAPGGVLGTLRLDESHLVLTNNYGARVAAFRGADYAANSRYALFGNDLVNTPTSMIGLLYGGYTLGTTFSIYGSQCGGLPITYSGNPTVGNQVTITVPGGSGLGTLFGFPGYLPLSGLLPNCNCILGVQNGILSSNPLTFNIPNNATFVGTTLSVQGYGLGTSCMSFLSLSDTVDFTIR